MSEYKQYSLHTYVLCITVISAIYTSCKTITLMTSTFKNHYFINQNLLKAVCLIVYHISCECLACVLISTGNIRKWQSWLPPHPTFASYAYGCTCTIICQ